MSKRTVSLSPVSPKTLKVRMYPSLSEIQGEGGINTVIRHLYKYLPQVGVELVDEESEADVVAVHAGLHLGVRGKPVVAMCHGVYWTAEGESQEWEYMANADVVESIREANAITVPSEWVAQAIERDMRRKPTVVPHGVEYKEWTNDEINEGYALWNKNRATDACDPTIVGLLAQRFPQYRFLSTFHPDSRTTDTFSPRRDYPNVTVLGGTISYGDMKPIVQRAAVYLATTKETFGIGMLEALASGVPILAYDEGSARDIVQHRKTGYLAKDQDDLFVGFEWLMKNRRDMIDACMDSVREYSWLHAAQQYRKVFQDAIQNYEWRQSGDCAIVIPCYNRGDTLARAIESALAQTRPASRIIVVDNNSQDDIRGIVDGYADSGVEYTNCTRQGVGHARNHGIAMLEEPYVCCLDADDEIAPDMLKVTVDALMRDQTLGIAYTGIYAIQKDGGEGIAPWPPQYNFDEFLTTRNQVPTCCVYRTDMWAALGGYRQRYGPKGAGAEDAEFFLRSGAHGWRAKKVTDEGLFVYHMNVGITSLPDYNEVNWRYYHPWVYDRRHPIGSLATANNYSHPALWYDNPYVTIVIPCAKKHVDYLWDAIDSIDGQTVRKWEIVVVYDFAFEDDVDQKMLREAFPFVRFVYTGGDRGAGAARNMGAKLATADNLLFLDADDFLRPDALDKMLTALHENDAVAFSDYLGHAYIDPKLASDLSRANRLVAFDNDDHYAHIRYHAFDYDCERARVQPEERVEPYLWCLVTSLTRKEWHDAIGGFDETMASWEDWDYWLRMAWSGICFTRIAEPLVSYRFYSGERRENGRQLAVGLLEYMREKREGFRIMPCGSCGRKSQPPVQPLNMTNFSIGIGGESMAGDGLLMVTLNDGNHGLHRFVGPVTKTDYGYRSHGDQFLIAPADYESRKDILLPVATEKPTAKPVAKAATVTVETATVAPNSGQPLASIDGIGAAALKSLQAAGINTVEDAVFAGKDALVALDKVGDKTVDLIFASA